MSSAIPKQKAITTARQPNRIAASYGRPAARALAFRKSDLAGTRNPNTRISERTIRDHLVLDRTQPSATATRAIRADGFHWG